MADMLRTWVENSQTNDAIKEETLRVLDEAKRIRASLSSENAQQEYDEVRLSTISALKDLQAKTSSELEQVRAELGWSIDPLTYQEGSISQNELWDITKEFNDLKDLSSTEEALPNSPENLSMFGSTILGYIEDTNKAILNGWPRVLEEQLLWYLSAFGGENGSKSLTARAAYLAASAVLTSEQMQSYAKKITDIKNSSENIYTRLFQLSQVLYEVWKEAGAPAELETAHNIATRNIIQKVIENSDKDFAIWFNESTWYYTTESINSNSSELEIGTYLCSLNKSWRLTKEKLLSIFSPTELFSLLEKYKNGAFGWEDIQGLFSGYLEGFEDSMNNIASEYLESEQNGTSIIDFFNAQSSTWNQTILYNSNNISRLTERTWDCDLSELNNPWLKKVLLWARARNIWEKLKEQVKELYKWGPDILSTLDAIIEFSIDAEEGDNAWFDFSGINEIIWEYNTEHNTYYPPISKNFQDQISSVFTKSTLEKNYTASIDTIDKINAEMKELFEELQRLHWALSQAERMWEYEAVTSIQQQINEINIKLWILKDKKEEISEMIENINFDVYKDIESIKYDFNNESEVQALLENRKYIKYISDENDILQLIEKSWNSIKWYEIHTGLQTNLNVLRALWNNITIYDIYRMPDNFFSFENDWESNYGKVYVLLSNIRWWLDTILDKFIRNNSIENKEMLSQILYQIIQDSNGNLTESQKTLIRESFLKKEEIVVFLNQEQKENLWYNPTIFEGNNDNAREKFLLVTERMFSPGYEKSDYTFRKWDIPTIIKYLEIYWFNEVKSQFLWLIRKKGLINTFQLSWIISTIPYGRNGERSAESMEIVLAGIKSRGADMLKPLSDEFKSDPSIIEAVLNNTPKDEWGDILSYIHITDFQWVLALYRSTGNSADDTAKYLELTGINKEILVQIINSTDEKNLDIIQDIVKKLDGNISIIMWNIKKIRKIKEYIDNSESIDAVEVFLEWYPQIEDKSYFIQLVSERQVIDEEIGEMIYKAFNGNKEEISIFVNWLLNASIQGKQRDLESYWRIIIQQPISRKLQDLLVKDKQGNYIIWVGQEQKLSQAFQNFLQENEWINIENARRNFLLTLWVNENNVNYSILSRWLESSEYIAKFLEQQKVESDIVTAISEKDWERLDKINTDISKAYLRWEISYNYNDIVKPSKKTESLAFKNSSSVDTQSVYREISTELLLTPEEQKSLTQEELNIIASDEKVRENFIGFRSTLVELGLTELWKFRNQIFKTIGSLDFNISDGDYIGENELNIFLSKTVYATTQDSRLKSPPSNLDTTKQIIREVNHQSGGINDIDAVNTVGEALTLIENAFRNKFAPRNAGILEFKVWAFKKALKWN